MSSETVKIIITAILVLHGLALGRASFVLIATASGHSSASWLPVRSWLFGSLSLRVNAAVAAIFWVISTVGFITAALLFWTAMIPGEIWRQIATASSIISTTGIILFSGNWPGAYNRKVSSLDTAIALVVNLAVLVAILWMKWPPYEWFGK